nr:hypothetical protein [Rhodoferax sp.]
MRFFCITHAGLAATNDALAAACDRPDIEAVMVSPGNYTANRDSAPSPGDVLYRAAPDVASARLEKLLWRPGVAAFYEDPFFEYANQTMLFQRHGMATPRTLLATNSEPAVAYRLVVVGDRVVAAEAQASGGEGWRVVNPSLGAATMALKAARLMRVEFGSVDLLEDQDGRLVLVALDYPCDFAAQQARSGVDIAGAMVDYLVNKCALSPAKDKNPYAKLNLHAHHRKAPAHETVTGLSLQ